MFENSNQGLAELNNLRAGVGVPQMNPPWHNYYFDESEVASWESERAKLVELEHFSSTYYLLSRVVYAKVAQEEGLECEYDSLLNRLGCLLPAMGTLGATKLWVWERHSSG